ncbi:MAG TPA: glycosyltransferase family 39 protein [Thermoanaerobaculia bacterium]|nr:glycosyltransferase family 39 protein [Thermoanaerobaculia bacterium]
MKPSAKTALSVLLILALASLSMLVFEHRGRVPFSSDQAIISLIGVDILEHGRHPVFCYGAEYAGTLEPHLLAVTFALFGATPQTFRLTMAALVLALILAVWVSTRIALGEREALAAGLYLAVGPSYFLYKGLSSDGAYVSLLLLSAVALGCAFAIDRRTERGESVHWLALGLGLTLGLAWWVHPLSAFLGAPIALAAATGRRRAWLAPSSLALGALGFLTGALPWWWHNLRHHWASLSVPELAAAKPAGSSQQLAALFEKGWSILLGGRSVWTRAETFPGSTWVAWFLLGVLFLAGLFEMLRGASRERRRAAALYLVILAAVPILNLAVQRTNFAEPRYLLPAYLAIAPLFGLALARLGRRAALAAALSAVALTLNAGSQIRAPRIVGFEGGYVESDAKSLVSWLEARGVRTLYASYWTAYRVTFLSHGRIIATPYGTGTNGFVRDLEHRDIVDASPDPAFLLEGEDRRRFVSYLKRRGLAPGRADRDGYTLFTGLDAETTDRLGHCLCIPAEPGASDVEWLAVRGPLRLPAGGTAVYRARFRSLLLSPLSSNVHLSYHWRRPGGEVVVADGVRSDVTTKAMDGQVAEAPVQVVADVPPGRYDLVIDLVDENVGWFENAGIPPPHLDVTVDPAPGRR